MSAPICTAVTLATGMIQCSGRGEIFPEASAVIVGTYFLCPACAAIEAGLILADPEQHEPDGHQTNCERCRRSLSSGDGRANWALCDSCAKQIESSPCLT